MIYTHGIYRCERYDALMNQVAKLFKNGRSQAVRLPKEYRFEGDEVLIRRQGEDVVISPKQMSWDDFFDQASVFDGNFLADREQAAPQERDS